MPRQRTNRLVWRGTPEFPLVIKSWTWIGNRPRLAEFSAKHGFRAVEALRETGSGLNGRRKALLRISAIENTGHVVEHRDRLMRCGFEYVEAALAAQGRRMVVMDSGGGDNRRYCYLGYGLNNGKMTLGASLWHPEIDWQACFREKAG